MIFLFFRILEKFKQKESIKKNRIIFETYNAEEEVEESHEDFLDIIMKSDIEINELILIKQSLETFNT